MRYIEKSIQPSSISEYIEAQTPVGHGLDYKTFASTASPKGGSRGGQLCGELIKQQFGLCAYTGTAIDDRNGTLDMLAKKAKLKPHNEHLKPQSVCRKELLDAGLQPGVDLGDDMNHANIVAAILVEGSDGFGAASRGSETLPIFPTNPNCEARFSFRTDGAIEASDPKDAGAVETITVLKLDHRTLTGWRKQAINTFVEYIHPSMSANQAKDRVRAIIEATTNPQGNRLPEFSFAIRDAVTKLLPPLL